MPQELQLGDADDALLLVDADAVVAEAFEDLSEAVLVLSEGRAGDEDVVDVDEHALQVSKDVVHQALARLSCISQAEGHPHCLEHAEGGDDSCLLDVAGLHWNLMEGAAEVQLAEEGTAVKIGGEVLQVWNGVPVWYGD